MKKTLKVKTIREYKCKDGSVNCIITTKDGKKYRIKSPKIVDATFSKNKNIVTLTVDGNCQTLNDKR
jgi:hypothetical protein